MSFIKTATAVAVIGFACSGTIAFAQNVNANVGTGAAASTAAGHKGMQSDGMTGRSSSSGAESLGTGNDHTTATGGRADKD